MVHRRLIPALSLLLALATGAAAQECRDPFCKAQPGCTGPLCAEPTPEPSFCPEDLRARVGECPASLPPAEVAAPAPPSRSPLAPALLAALAVAAGLGAWRVRARPLRIALAIAASWATAAALMLGALMLT